MENNTVKITGKIMETPEYLLTSPDRRKIYKSTIEVMRTSGNMDVIPIQVPEQIVQEIRDNVGGELQSLENTDLTMKRMEKEII